MNNFQDRIRIYKDAGYVDNDTLPADTIMLDQYHTSTILRPSDDLQTEADGMYIPKDFPHPVAIRTADCIPLFLHTTSGDTVALHVSRKTLIFGLLDNVSNFIDPTTIDAVWIGPHICEKCLAYKVEGGAIEKFRELFPEAVDWHKGKIYLSLRKAVQHYFDKWGVDPSVIVEDKRCTYEDDNEFFSYHKWVDLARQGRVPHLYSVLHPAH